MFSELVILTSFFFNDTATTEIYTLSLHDALPIYGGVRAEKACRGDHLIGTASVHLRRHLERPGGVGGDAHEIQIGRATSELQSHVNLVCRLLLEKKKKTSIPSSLPHITPINPSST